MTSPDETTTAIGARVRTLREAAGLTQLQLATAVGVARSSIATIETGRQGDLRTALLARIAAALDTTLAAVLAVDPEERLAKAEARIARLEDEVRRVVRILSAAGQALQASDLATNTAKGTVDGTATERRSR